MKRIAVMAAILSSAVSLAHAQVKDSAMAVQEAEAVVTVTKIDKEARTVTFRGPRGNLGTLDVPKESQNFDQVKVGQQYKMKYVEAVAVEIRKGGAPSATAAQEVKLAPKGAKPGGVVTRTVQLAGVVEAVD
jgi:Cu/Ag efflux protein CusF